MELTSETKSSNSTRVRMKKVGTFPPSSLSMTFLALRNARVKSSKPKKKNYTYLHNLFQPHYKLVRNFDKTLGTKKKSSKQYFMQIKTNLIRK